MNETPFAERLRLLRAEAMLSQAELAAQVGVNWRVIQRWEHGKAFPRPRNRRELCRVLRRSSQELFGLGQ